MYAHTTMGKSYRHTHTEREYKVPPIRYYIEAMPV